MIGFLLMNIWYIVDFYMIEVVNMRMNSLSWCMVLVILLVSSGVILCSIDYLSVLDSDYFLLLISLSQFVMLSFVIPNDLIIVIINRDWLGLISYLLINFWASKTKSGIKAVVYNQVGDPSFSSIRIKKSSITLMFLLIVFSFEILNTLIQVFIFMVLSFEYLMLGLLILDWGMLFYMMPCCFVISEVLCR